MKKFITLLFLVCLSIVSHAQKTFEFGFKASYGRQKITSYNRIDKYIIIANPSGEEMTHAGLWFRYRYKCFFIQQEFYIADKIYDFGVTNTNPEKYPEYLPEGDTLWHKEWSRLGVTFYPTYIETPISLGLSVYRKKNREIRLQMGINPQWLKFPRKTVQQPFFEAPEYYANEIIWKVDASQKKFYWSSFINVGVDIGRFSFDLRYHQNLSPIHNNITLLRTKQTYSLISKAHHTWFSVGYKFGRGKKIEKPSLLNF